MISRVITRVAHLWRMSVSRSSLQSLFGHVLGDSWSASPWHGDQLLREELFSIERLEEHAASLAAAQQVASKPPARRPLHARLKNNESALLAAYRATAAAVAEGRAITPAAEWVLDNYHLVEEQIREIREDLPPGFYRQLPKLAAGPFAGYPRVFGLAWAFVAHTDSRFDPDTLRRYLRAYQGVQPLTIGELWAVAITLRIVLVENLRRAADGSVIARIARQDADAIADRLLGLNGLPMEPDALLHRHDAGAALAGDFAAQLVQRLRDQDPRVTPALLWLEQRLSAQGTTSADIVRAEHQRQGASNVTVRNIITSMRLISDVDWAELFESVSFTDDLLRAHSAFADMDFATRNLYRSAIEHLARRSPLTELEVAARALECGTACGDDDDARRVSDPGYRLIGGGRRAFERAIGYRPTLRRVVSHIGPKRGVGCYIAAIGLAALFVLLLPLLALDARGLGLAGLVALSILGLMPALDAAVALVNHVVTRSVGASILPGLALRNGVPAHLRTLVAVPVLLTTLKALAEQIERLEIHHLASPEGELYFALLSDGADAPDEHLPEDEQLLDAATAGIARLNETYPPGEAGKRFLLLHRRRVWSDSERCWMGWERKRGKIHELNHLLRGAEGATFLQPDGRPPAVPADVRFVITLDADTRLPRDAARRLIGKLAHPLNRPRFDRSSGRVLDGYAILQPRITPSLPLRREGSLFQRVFSSTPGIDPYASAASDVYQDLFGEGSYTGKGIYDVDAFEAALAGRAPVATLLSHDLFEGIFARAGLASDIEVVEDFPQRYDVAALRQHRWARGDWQLLPWILGRGDAAAVRRGGHGGLPLIGAWKMLDNLRRSLSAPAAVAALLAGWALPAHAAMVWTAFVLATIALPSFMHVVAAIVPRRAGITARSHGRAFRIDLQLATAQAAMLIIFLAHQAWSAADAVVRSVYRVFISHRNLLEWVTAAQSNVGSRLTLAAMYRHMYGGVVIGAIALVGLIATARDAWWVGVPFAILWLLSPVVARWVSDSPVPPSRLTVTIADTLALRAVARRTWRFFEAFVTAEDHDLPPDNFQESPRPILAHRTSPTNVGLYLLSLISARDFGWAGTLEIVDRLEATLASLGKLPRFRGHFYNWYETREMRILEPGYVSTVDSGNLAAHLMAVTSTCREWGETLPSHDSSIAGTTDALRLARDAARSLPATPHAHLALRRELDLALDSLDATLPGAVASLLPGSARLSEIAAHAATLADIARALAGDAVDDAYGDLVFWTEATRRSIASLIRDLSMTGAAIEALRQRARSVAATAKAMTDAMDFAFLVNQERRLLSIGYRAADTALDPSCYDLLASEARLASFVAIAKGDVPARHWFRLGRPVTPVGHGAALVSWSGSMFEYLMPSLVMRAPAGSLLEQTSRLIVRRQIGYAEDLGIPWGVSESAYNARDMELTYQYSNFGVPGLGLKRGLRENAVVAPYATALAAMIDPEAAARNFERLTAVGALGRYGFYEALDYTRARLPDGATVAIVRAFMAHHQGMTIVAIANALLHGKMRERFHAQASVRATELLLQERTPRDVSVARPRAEEVLTAAPMTDAPLPHVRRLRSAHDATPQTHLLSNGRYTVMLTAAGSGFSRWNDLAVTRWREDISREDHGSYVLLRDVASDSTWSAGFQPCGVEPETYEATFTEDRAELIRRDGTLTTTLEVLVSPEDDAEVRRVSVTNLGFRVREIEITSYCELVLAPLAADIAHPAFSKLFVQTEFVAAVGALVATRRPRSPSDAAIWTAHHAVVEGEGVAGVEFETDRARFLGRGRELRAAVANVNGRPLSNAVGTVLDPVFALRYRLRIAPGATARIAFWTAVASSRERVLDMVDKHHEPNAFARACTLAWTQAQVQLRHLNIDAAEATLFQRLAGYVLYADASMRPSADAIQRGAGGPAAIWSQGISGDLPIVLLRIADIEDMAIARQLLRAHEYWRSKRLAVDLVILNERASSYVQDLQAALETALRTSQSRPQIGGDAAHGSVFILRADLISAETRAVLSSVARAVLYGPRGSLEDQLDRVRPVVAPALPTWPRGGTHAPSAEAPVAPRNLEFFNGLGGFANDGSEYVTLLGEGQTTPAPWINVIANPHFGFQVATDGAGYTWSLNSREYQLTPWSNDPVTDRPGEVLYLRDEDSGELWTPTAAPIRDSGGGKYTARHGQGYSRFEHASHGIGLDLVQFVPVDDSIKVSRLLIRNLSARSRRLSVTAYLEWVLGPSRSAAAPSIVTSIDAETSAFLASNPWNAAFGTRVAFADLRGQQSDWTGDRREFLGRHGTLAAPAALRARRSLSKRVGAGLDPCCALQATVVLEANATTEIVFLLGEAASTNDARSLVTRYRSADLDEVLASVIRRWNEVLGTVQVTTPDRSLDLMLNRWLLYQTLACRMWARSAFYQASGAYGFRDQLQDGMALAISTPRVTRAHLLCAAARQFTQGDVQHWWLPQSGQGVRTQISDDPVWLAYAVAQYVETTGDTAVLDELVPFLEGQLLGAGEHEAYFQPAIADEVASLYQHCARALDRSLPVGDRGLPLIGTGDWNDGMNRVGELGRGESVWLGWFLYAALLAFAPLARRLGDNSRSERWIAHATGLRAALERAGWDGDWYRRAYYDDGTPLGSAASSECRIDAIAQSWSVISGAAEPARASRAMRAVQEQLVRADAGLALLFTPPFDHTPLDPGYIKGYPPGVRENGGQYTHAAAWSVIALAMLGEGDKAMELLAMLNPVNRTSTRAAVQRYKVEPYVTAADVYSVAPHVGRGGWTWYTGSSGWMYRAGLEWILGFRRQGASLLVAPCIPRHWPRVDIAYRHGSARYDIVIENPDGVSCGVRCAELDGRPLPAGEARIPLVDDGASHHLRVTLGLATHDAVESAASASLAPHPPLPPTG
jgi:cyclic beta-1,2-glucan synthetase